MKLVSALFAASAALVVALPPAQKDDRRSAEIMAALRRDPTGLGFTHVGSDDVARNFDGGFNVVDAAPLQARSTAWSRSPAPAVLAEAKAAKGRSLGAVQQAPRPRERSAVETRQGSCVSVFCPDDQYCVDQSLYGYNCSSCLMVSDGIGNCQPF